MKPIKSVIYFSILFSLLTNSCVSQSNPSATQLLPQETQPLSTSTSTLTPKPLATSTPTKKLSNILFDDFNYSTREEMTANSWIIRFQAGWPGMPGATFRPENVSFVDDTVIAGNRKLRMSSSTDGTSINTFQTQICHQRKYLEGTYAARVYFTNEPVRGLDSDQVVETFYAITPYEEALDPDYSEMDFEYLPNGGWSWGPMSFMFTTWETVRIEPWLAENTNNFIVEDQGGWRTLVVQVKEGRVRYYIDGRLTVEHSGNYYPDAPMSINFNLWFVNGGTSKNRDPRTYQEDIDWVFHEAGVILSPEQVNETVGLLRESTISFLDTVPETTPPLTSPCDL